MPEAPRAVILAFLVLLPATAASDPASPPRASRPTVEPTLPLVVDLRLVGVERAANRARARLEIDLHAGGVLEHIELSVGPLESLRLPGGTALPSDFTLTDGEHRLLVIPLEGPADRDLPIRLDASFRTADGRAFRLGHGLTLEAPRPGAGGRSHLGAWEVPAVPIEVLRP